MNSLPLVQRVILFPSIEALELEVEKVDTADEPTVSLCARVPLVPKPCAQRVIAKILGRPRTISAMSE
jgi:hypothetical protein